MSPSVSVVIPAGTTAALPLLLGALPPAHEVIVVVEQGEETSVALPRAARVIRQTRTGVGNAMACGVAAATGDVVVTLAADGSCDPADVTRFVAALRDGDADVVQGSRYLAGTRSGSFARWADLIVLWFVNVLFGCRPTDPGFGYRAFWRDSADRLGLPRVAGTEPVHGDGREIEPLLTVRTGLAGLHVAELPTSAYPRVGRAGAPLLPALRALFAERKNRRDAGTEPESIVIMTGGTTPESIVNKPHVNDRWLGSPTRAWPAPNPPRAAGPLPAMTRFAGTVQPTDAELFNRRRWRDKPDSNPDREPGTARRRVQGRPNLRVINGEGSGTGGTRGHLRSV
ncbi:glycosyltransferase family 2 protein [Actinoplanes sp. NPDC051861]|uniref:glycosyltransferase family 2 protein n=1 Tax=Actinoplanes sp. NPDC051861 TaxID=3155170 RepID=UPI00344A4490